MIVHDLILATRRAALTGIERFAINTFNASSASGDVLALVSPGSSLAGRSDVVEVGSGTRDWAGAIRYLRSLKCRGMICAAFPAGPSLLLSRVPIVRVIHDALAWTMPQNLTPQGRLMFAHWDRWMLHRYDHVFAPTQIVCDELGAIFPKRKIGICGNAPGLDWESAQDSPPPQLHGRSFVLAVGTVEPRKNYERVIELARNSLDARTVVVIAGRAGWGETADRLRAAQLAMPGRLHWLEDVSDAALRWLYRHCDAFLSLSHAEGFNMPLVEAGSSGCRIVCSDIPIHAAVAPPWASRISAQASNETLWRALRESPAPDTAALAGFRLRHNWSTIAQTIEAPLLDRKNQMVD